MPGACDTLHIALTTLPSRISGLVAVGALQPALGARCCAGEGEKGDETGGMLVFVQLGGEYNLPDGNYDAVGALRDDGVVMLGGEPDLFRLRLISFSRRLLRAGGLLLVGGYNLSAGRRKTSRGFRRKDSPGTPLRSFAPGLEKAPWGASRRRCGGLPSENAVRVLLATGRGLSASRRDLGCLARFPGLF